MNKFGEKTMQRTVFFLLVLALFVLAACGAPPVTQQDTQPADAAPVAATGPATSPVVTVYKPPT